MAGKKKSKRKKTRVFKTPEKCPFCEKGLTPSYAEHKVLKSFLSDRAKIFGSDRTGVCSRHQRRLSREVKRARHLGLLPFTPTL
jgi:small subunit ribosomal protein S18